MAIKAKITSTNSAGPQKVSVTLPASGGSVTSVGSTNDLTDVQKTVTLAGSFLQINADGGAFISQVPKTDFTDSSATTIHGGAAIQTEIQTGTATLSNKTLEAPVITGNLTATGATFQGATPLQFDGSTSGGNVTQFAISNPTADRTITFPDATGSVITHGQFSGDATVATTGAITLATVNSDTSAIGSSTAIPVITANAKGLVTSITTASITTSLTIGADSGSNDAVALATDTLNFEGGNNITTTVSDNNIKIDVSGSPAVTSLTFEGATDDSFETTLAVTDPTADRTVTLPNATGTVVLKDTTDTLTNKTLTSPTITTPSITTPTITSGGIIFEGATADSFETTLAVTDATADRTITLPNVTGTVSLITASETLTNKQLTSPVIAEIVGTGGILLNAVQDITLDAGGADIVLKDDGTEFGRFTNTSGELVIKSSSSATAALTLSGANVTAEGNLTVDGNLSVSGTTTTVDSSTINIQNAVVFEGGTDDSFETTLTTVDPTADRTISLPNATDTLVGKATTDTLTNKTLTTPVIAEIDSNSSITLDAATDIILDAGEQDIILKDDGTEFGRFTNNSGNLQIKSGGSATTAITMSGANVTIAGNLTVTGATEGDGNITIGDTAADTITFGGTIQGSLLFEGSTADSFETTLTPGNPSADITLTMPSSGSDTLVGKATTDTFTNKSIDLETNTLTGSLAEFNAALQSESFVSLTGSETLTNKTLTSPTIATPSITGNASITGSIVFEGSTADSFETTLQVTDPTADRTITLPNATDTLVGRATTDTLTNKTLTSPVVSGLSLTDSSIVFEGSSSNSFETTLTVTNPTADRTITLQDGSGTLAFLTDVTGGGAAGSFTTLATTGNVTLGDASSDTVTFNARVASSILPSANETFDLGSASLRWNDLFLAGSTINLGGASISSDGTVITVPNSSKFANGSLIPEADSITGLVTRDVPLFTKAGGLDTAAKTFKMKAGGASDIVFVDFTRSNGSNITAQERAFFSF
jgi:hypothetical protein